MGSAERGATSLWLRHWEEIFRDVLVREHHLTRKSADTAAMVAGGMFLTALGADPPPFVGSDLGPDDDDEPLDDGVANAARKYHWPCAALGALGETCDDMAVQWVDVSDLDYREWTAPLPFCHGHAFEARQDGLTRQRPIF